MRSGLHVGIDLGTTNSAIAVFDGDTVSVVANAIGENLTPTVVRIDGRGGRTVGRRALHGLASDPANTRGEWKRLMGTAERLRFEAAGAELLPEELSAAVLTSLLADARDVLGFLPRAAVISTPALFELPQSHATARAGRLAGLDEVVLIQEPVASAVAAGWRAENVDGGNADRWLVFDWGGGTLDVSLLQTTEGRLRVVDHAGDNFLGGRDIDGAVTEWALGELARRGRSDVMVDRSSRRGFARLRAACEQAKIELSRAERTVIALPEVAASGGGTVDVDIEMTRADLDGLTAPFIARALSAVRTLLDANHCALDDVARVVLVGGPTLMPALRGRVAELFGGRIAEGVDPMTIVARGAALYAGSAGVDAAPARAPEVTAGVALRIEHPPVTADAEPFVVGRFLPSAGEAPPARVRVTRDDGGWQSGDARCPPRAASSCRWRWRGIARTGSACSRSTATAPASPSRRRRSPSCTACRSPIRRWRAPSASRAPTT